MSDVVWGHPSGHSEASFFEDWHTQDDWPPVSPATLQQLRAFMPRLISTFVESIGRRSPPGNRPAGDPSHRSNRDIKPDAAP